MEANVEQQCQVQLEVEVIEYILGLDDLTDQNKLQSIMLKEFMRRAKTAGIPLSDDPCTVLLIWRSGNDNK